MLGAGSTGTQALPVLFLPGFVGDSLVWMNQAAMGDGRTVWALDLPEVDADLVELASEFLGRVPWPRFAVVGLSLGGLVGWAMSLAAPGRVAQLVTVGTLPHVDVLPSAWGMQQWGARFIPVFRTVYRHRIRTQLRAEGVPPEQAETLSSMLPNRATVLARCRAISAWPLNEPPPVPTTWLRGQVDAQAPWTAEDVQHHLPDVDFQTIPGGHFAPLTHAREFEAVLRPILTP